MMTTLVLAFAYNSSPVAAQDSQTQSVTDQSPTGELTFWNGIKDSNDVASFKTYLKNFPNGMFYDLALAKYRALGGNVADVKPATNSSVNHKALVKTVSSGTIGHPKAKNIVVKKQPVRMSQKKIVRYNARKAHVNLVKKTARKLYALKSNYIVKRKPITPTREGGGGGGAAGGGGSGGSSHW
jgi:hypothetical protein